MHKNLQESLGIQFYEKALDFKREGDEVEAIINFRKAIDNLETNLEFTSPRTEKRRNMLLILRDCYHSLIPTYDYFAFTSGVLEEDVASLLSKAKDITLELQGYGPDGKGYLH
jgi:hypothetical protein